MKKLVRLEYKIQTYEKIDDKNVIKYMFITVNSIDNSYFLNLVMNNKFTDLILVFTNYLINLIYQ